MNKRYIYVNKNEAKKGTALVHAVTDEPIGDYKEYFKNHGLDAIEFIGEDLPHFITYDDVTDSIREATEEEKLARNQRELASNEIIDKDGKIISYDPQSQKIVDDEVVEKTREDYISEGVITLDSERNKARAERTEKLKAVDLYDKAVLRGDITETAEMKKLRDEYRRAWLELPEIYENLQTPITEFYPKSPKVIAYFE